jgi:AcrR family transcriptional regulator
MVTRRERLRDAAKEEIKTIARAQMAEQGTAAINWREIARQMGVTPTALYRYYATREDLITELIVDAFNALADAALAAEQSVSREDYAGRLLAALEGYRQWAVDHKTDFQLIYGNPIPGYHAPFDVTVQAARRNMAILVAILQAALQAGALKPTAAYQHPPDAILEQFRHQHDYGVDQVVLYIGVAGWARIHGMIMLEIFGHTPPVVGDTAAFYRHEVLHMMREMGLTLRQ